VHQWRWVTWLATSISYASVDPSVPCEYITQLGTAPFDQYTAVSPNICSQGRSCDPNQAILAISAPLWGLTPCTIRSSVVHH